MPRTRLKKRKDGRYLCKANGISFYGYTEREAKEKRARYLAELQQGLDYSGQNTTLDSYARKWLPVYRAACCENSYLMYANILDRFIARFPENVRIRDINQTDIVSYYTTLSELSPSYIDKHVSTIRGLFEAAEQDGIIPKNPTRNVKPPDGVANKRKHRPIEDWERELVHQMIDVDYSPRGAKRIGHPFAPAAIAMLYQGLRVGEALALDIDRDVDFENNRLYIRENLSFSDTHRGRLKGPKTITGIRSMPLFKPFRDVVEGKTGRLVKSPNGGEITQSVFSSMWRSYKYQIGVLRNGGKQKRWCENFEEITIKTHDFRHSFVTMICDAGVDIKTAMSWVGHSDEKMIRQIYDHVTREREHKAEQNTAQKIEEIIDKKGLSVQKSVQSVQTNPESVDL